MPPQLQHKEAGDEGSGLLDSETFAATATERMKAASRMNSDHNLTFFMLDGLAPAFYLMAAAALSLAFVLTIKDGSKAALK